MTCNPIPVGETKYVQITWKASVAILGARMHYAVPSVLASQNRLTSFYTDWYSSGSGWKGWVRRIFLSSPVNLLRRIAMRSTVFLPNQLVRSFPFLGLLYALSLRINAHETYRERMYVFFGKKFSEKVRDAVLGDAKVLYGMNTASLELFRAASKAGKTLILEQSIAPYIVTKRLLLEEHQLWPGWERGKISGVNVELAERERQEWELSDLILAGSDFVKGELLNLGVPENKCRVVPYTMDVNAYKVNSQERSNTRELRVLFLGSVGLRKGIQYLYQSLGMLDNGKVKAKAAGTVSLSPDTARRVGQRIELLGLVPRAETHHIWQWADVLVLPSICEGSALVTYEALASGVPVITTPNSGSPVQDGITGFIVPIRNAEAIAERLEQLARTPELQREMSIRAREYAEQHLSLEAYSARLISAIESVIA